MQDNTARAETANVHASEITLCYLRDFYQTKRLMEDEIPQSPVQELNTKRRLSVTVASLNSGIPQTPGLMSVLPVEIGQTLAGKGVNVKSKVVFTCC